MPLYQVGQTLDRRTARMLVRYEGGSSSDNGLRFVPQCVLSAGMAPSYAFATVPMSTWGPGQYDQKGLAVALKQDGPAGDVKLLTRAAVDLVDPNGEAQTILTGWLVSQNHVMTTREDSCTAQIYCDKWLLNKISKRLSLL